MESAIVLFLSGAAAFVSPCVLPLIPAYIFYLAGRNPKEIDRPDAKLIVNGLMFIAGFSIVFMLLGATASAIGFFLSAHKREIRLISGILVILFGVFQTGLIQLSFLNREKRFEYRSRASVLSSLLMGMAFGFGWTPCIGYTLMPALMAAANQQTIWQGVGLLGIYSLGFALPFILLSVLLKYAFKWLESIKKYMGIIKIVSGLVLVAMGILMLLGWV